MTGRPSVPPAGRWTRFVAWLNTETNGASLAVFRIAVGFVMALEAWSLCRPSASFSGQIPLRVFYTGPDVKFHFAYPGFHWLPVLPASWMYAAVGVLGVSGVMFAAGFCYRMAAALVFLTWGYLYAIESTRTYWMSYHYLELLITFLMIWMPAARRFSVDAWLSRRPALRTVPHWTLLLLRGQLVISYVYAGVAKLNADWLLDAEPVRYYLSQGRWLEDYGTWFTTAHLTFLKRLLQSNELAYFISYAGALFDLSVGFLLLFRRTRIFGMVLLLVFHGTNHFLIFKDIEWFPLLGVLTASIFFDPDWPERVGRWLRRPRLVKPEWGWFAGGGILFPILGAALGWRRPANPPVATTNARSPLPGLAPALVCAWLAWQALLPARHFLIPGDARFTWEGLTFSWRLKAEVYRSTPCELSLEDARICSRDEAGHCRIDWAAWHGEKVIYRSLVPGRTNWGDLPEVIVLLEPLLGQRILYNPFAGSATGRSEAESRARVRDIWQEIYGHQPQIVLRTAPSADTLSACAAALRARGRAVHSTLETSQMLEQWLSEHEDPELITMMRQTHPLALEGGPNPASPFLLIEDSALVDHPGSSRMRVEPARWVDSPYTTERHDSFAVSVGGRPLIVYASGTLFELKDKIPRASIFDSENQPAKPAVISWNYLDELTYSQGMHLGLQPFLLREYAQHISNLWEREYGRLPSVRAETAVSLNGRPLQRLVDPTADLARAPLAWFHHNAWIRRLELPRIPPGASLK